MWVKFGLAQRSTRLLIVDPDRFARRGQGFDPASFLPAPRAIQSALLVLQIVHVTLSFRIGHSFVTTLRIFRQPIVVIAALAIRHPSISALFVSAEPAEFQVYRRVRAECARVAWIEPTIAIVAQITYLWGHAATIWKRPYGRRTAG